MKKIILISLLAVFACNGFAQTQKLDSLENVLSTKTLNPNEQLSIYDVLCREYRHNNLEKFFLYANKGLKLAEKEKNQKVILDFNKHMGEFYAFKGKFDTTLVYYDKVLNLSVKLGDKEMEAIMYGSIGNVYSMQGKDSIALEYYKRALPIYENLGDKKNYIKNLSNIAGLHTSLLNHQQAIYYLEQAKEIAEEIDDIECKMYVYYGLANTYSMEGKFDESIDYGLKSLDISRIIGHKQAEIVCLSILAYNYCRTTRDYDKAEQYALECLHYAEIYGDPRLFITAWSILSTVYLYQERYKDAEIVSLKSWEADSTINMENLNTLSNLTSAYIKLGEQDKAIYFFKKCLDLLVKYSDQNFNNAIANMEVKYETEKKEMRITALEEEKKLYAIISIAGIAILLLAFGLLLFRHRHNIQKRKLLEQQRELSEQKIKQLEQEKQLIASQAVIDGETAERTRLARDLHDGLGGMLSVVKLNLRDMKGYALIENTDVGNFNRAVEMLDLSIAELRRVSHHIMPDLSSGLKMPLEDFCRSIPEAKFRFFGDDSHLDNRLKITVYRCAHELINNAIKHARATEINVQLVIDGNLISLSVQDDGIGFDVDRAIKGLGLENVRARAAIYNGKVNIYSSPEKGGTEVNVEIELA